MIGVKGLSSLLPVLRAQIRVALGEFGDALGLLEVNLEAAVREGMGRLKADLMADIAWCRVNLGQSEAAKRDAVAAEALIDPAGQFDDRAMAHGRLAQVFAALGEVDDAARHKRLALDAFTEHEALKTDMLRLLCDSPETHLDR